MNKLNCFVVQGFGPKTDYTDGRVLNLDASYDVIKDAVEEAGLNCFRADEIVHSGTIDIPMYEQLLRADLVIADLSTYNVNAAFELGVRFALRPRSTIVIAEEKFKSPFDVNHIVIRRYKHMGEDIGTHEAQRFKKDLISAITHILDELRTDSPVYSLLPYLRPPEYVMEQASGVTIANPPVEQALSELKEATGSPSSSTGTPQPDNADVFAPKEGATPSLSARQWLERAQQAMAMRDFEAAKISWKELCKLKPNDSYAIRQLARATYKAEQPPTEETLLEVRELLTKLSPSTTNNPETLGIWGEIHRHLWDLKHEESALGEAIAAYERSFNLKQDPYNDINLAFMLNVRAVESVHRGLRHEAIADSVWAQRVCREVTRYMTPLADDSKLNDEKKYWIVATLWEATLGLRDVIAAAKWDEKARALNVPQWMHEARKKHGERLLALQKELDECSLNDS